MRIKNIASILTFGVLGMLVVSACVQQKPEQTGSLTVEAPPSAPVVTAAPGGTLNELPPNPPTSTVPEPGPGWQKTVTREDQGKTVTLAVGESFLLKLGEEYTWEVSISDQNVLSRVKNIVLVSGSQGVYEAHQAGTVTLNATGDPLCRQSKPQCMMPSILIEITVLVK